jgi:CRISPR-associated endonuclease/helicase Cas3
MTLERHDFATFYAAVNAGHRPFAWQERLLDHLLVEGRWPGRIVAPTGAGKTSAIDVHVFAVALTAGGAGPRLPRRLAMVVGRRVLVDDQHDRARALASALVGAPTDGHGDVVGRVAARLGGLRWPAEPTRPVGSAEPLPESPLVVGRLRGGAAPSRAWRDHPTACAVLCATPDMWGSRLLFNGYGTRILAAPREAGMLAFDTAVVVDEAHLSGQLLESARGVARLVGVAERPLPAVPGLQVVETTATPSGDAATPNTQTEDAVGVHGDDLTEPVLADRLTRPKPVDLLRVPGWPARQPGKTAAAVAARVEAVLERLRSPTDDGPDGGTARTVGCFVNTVPMAIAVAEAIRRTEPATRVVMVCGQTRPADLDRLRRRYPGLLSPEGNREVDVIVTTQSLEVGVDLDLAAVVTELASGTALAQRAGRVNRRGLRESGPVTVVVPEDEIAEDARSGPYDHVELTQARAWVLQRAADPAGLAPWALRGAPPPASGRRRMLYQRPELADAWHWARTSDELAANPELDLWLSESFDDDTSVGLVVRDALPQDPVAAVELIRDLQPRRQEIFPVPYRTARAVLKETSRGRPVAIRVRGEEVTALEEPDGERNPSIRPGDVVVVDSAAAIFSGGKTGDDFSPPVVVARAGDDDAPDGVEHRGRADDVLHLAALVPRPGEVVLRLELTGPAGTPVAGLDPAAVQRQVRDLTGPGQGVTETERRLRLQSNLLGLLQEPGACSDEARPMVEAAADLLGRRVKDSDVVLRYRTAADTDGTDQPVGIVVLDRRRAGADDELRQVFSTRDPNRGPVTLAEHQGAVAARAALLGRGVGLPEHLVAGLHLAGAHHDDGKADPRFQVRLGADGSQTLAKSDPRSTVWQVREREAQTGLPTGWRHEQLSVARCWDSLTGADDPELVARLVGTSHGYGRSGFPRPGHDLLGSEVGIDEASRKRSVRLFDEGEWDELIEQTQVRYGVWGCAYLEALLRAADGQVSGEGS